MTTPKPDFIDKAWRAFVASLNQPIETSQRALWATLFCVFGLALVMGSSPTLYLNDMALDAFIPLDGALRMTEGQWPHADFYTPIGALYYVLLGAAATLTGGGAVTVFWAQLLFVPAAFALAWIATRDRLPTPHRVGLVLLASVATLSPRTLDSDSLISHLAAYNRLGWVVTGIVFMAVAIEPVRTDRRRETVEAIALLTCTVMAFYLKITFFALCGAALAIAVLSRPVNWRAPLAAGVGSLLVLGLGSLLFETNALYLADLQRAASSGTGQGSLIRMDRFQSIFAFNRISLLGPVLFLLWLVRTSPTEAAHADASKWIVKLGALMAAATVVTSQSHDAAMPVLTVVAVACFAALHRRQTTLADNRALGLVGLISMAMIAWPIALDTQAIVRHAAMSRSADTVPLAAIEGSPVTQIRIPAPAPGTSNIERVLAGSVPARLYDSISGTQWNQDDDIILRDAQRLLAAHGKTDARIASLTFSPCFPWMLGTSPPRHLPAWYDYRRTFDGVTTGDVEAMLSDTDVILVPRVWLIEGLWRAYGDYVEAHFVLIGETPLWSLWSR